MKKNVFAAICLAFAAVFAASCEVEFPPYPETHADQSPPPAMDSTYLVNIPGDGFAEAMENENDNIGGNE